MTAYYNDVDPYVCAWVRNLIHAKLVPSGEVDERSIADVQPSDLEGFTQCHFFCGVLGWPLALRIAGFPDTRECWTGSCPCQPFSVAGQRNGFADERHLWPEFKRLVAKRRPPTVFGEQVAAATQWLGLVRSDLETMGYAVGAIPIEAASAGADHLRDRFWFVADCTGEQMGRSRQSRECFDVRGVSLADANIIGVGPGREQRSGEQRGTGGDQEACAVGDGGSAAGKWNPGGFLAEEARECRPDRALDGNQPDRLTASSEGIEWIVGADGKARRVKSGIRLLAHGIPARVDKLRALGNAIDHRPAAEFIRAYLDCRP